MLLGLAIRDLVLIEGLDLAFGPGLTALTGETGAGKSIILGALGLATGARADGHIVRKGAREASASAVFAPGPDHAIWAMLDEKGLSAAKGEDLVLRRTVGLDGRSRAFVNDEPVGVGLLKELGALLVEVHGQHETAGLLDARRHRALVDAYAGATAEQAACALAWRALHSARQATEILVADQARAAAERERLAENLAELDRLDPREDEEESLAEERRLLASAEKTLADIASAREHLGGEDLGTGVGQALRALERARDRTGAAAAAERSAPLQRLIAACEAAERALIELGEVGAAVDAAAAAFDFEPDRLERAEARLFALRAMARRLEIGVGALGAARARIAQRLMAIENAESELAVAQAAATAARAAYATAAAAVTLLRRAAGARLEASVKGELGPLKLDKAAFRVVVEPEVGGRAGPQGVDRVEFEIATLPGAPFAPLGAIASGGELARFALAIKASLAARAVGAQPVMIFDEVDQGVGGAVADAVGVRLKRLATQAQVLVVTHSPQVAARADAHWRVDRLGDGGNVRAEVEVLSPSTREEEIARMLSGARVSDAARAAARALMHA